jgi:hypothetical protein
MELLATFGISQRIEELISNLEELEKAKFRGLREIELSRAGFITPFSILPLVVYAINNKLKINCTEDDYDVCSYLDTIGFPNGVTELPSKTKRYLPITKLPPIEENNLLSEYEDRILSQVNTHDCSFKTSLKYLTSELVNNVNEHANIDHYWILAQYYPVKNTCEIAMADCGIGYKKSYVGTDFEVDTDLEAIENALEGKSSKSARLHISERGKGIPSIVNLFVNGYGGNLIIVSGTSMVYYRKNEKTHLSLKSYWNGSLVVINFDLKTIKNPLQYVDI